MASTISASDHFRAANQGHSHLELDSPSGKAFYEGGHLLEKLEFALALSETRGDQIRSAELRAQIVDLGGNIEEPGT